MMYDEFVKRLREHGEFLIDSDRTNAPPNVNVRNVFAEDYAQAADAIEQLSNAGSAYGRGWTLGYDAGREESKPCWIPMSEKLPEKSEHYLVHINCWQDGKIMSSWMQVAWFCKKFYWEHLHSEDVFKETVTHWMPLPEPPKEKPTCEDCQRECQMMGLDMEACASYEPPEELIGTDMGGGIRRDDAGNVIDWGITGPPGDVGKTEEGE